MKDRMFSYSDAEVKALIGRLYDKMIAWISRHFGETSKVNPEDVLQEVFYRLLVKRPAVPADKIDGYVFRMIRNECTNLATRHPRTMSLEEGSGETAWEILSAIDMEDSIIDIREPSRDTSTVSDILSFSQTFDPRTREIFQMSRIQGMTHEQIAREMGISTRAVEKHLQTSVKAFRKRFPSS